MSLNPCTFRPSDDLILAPCSGSKTKKRTTSTTSEPQWLEATDIIQNLDYTEKDIIKETDGTNKRYRRVGADSPWNGTQGPDPFGERIGLPKEDEYVMKLQDPVMPSKEQVEVCYIKGHIPFRSWCHICVDAFGKELDHRKDEGNPRKLPEYSWGLLLPGRRAWVQVDRYGGKGEGYG